MAGHGSLPDLTHFYKRAGRKKHRKLKKNSQSMKSLWYLHTSVGVYLDSSPGGPGLLSTNQILLGICRLQASLQPPRLTICLTPKSLHVLPLGFSDAKSIILPMSLKESQSCLVSQKTNTHLKIKRERC